MNKVLCDKCGIFYSRIDNFKRHYKEKHDNNIEGIKCILCEEIFIRRENLKRHFKQFHQSFEQELLDDFNLSVYHE